MIFILLFLTLILFFLAIIALLVKTSKYQNPLRIFSFVIAVLGILGAAFWFVQKSTDLVVQDVVSAQFVNKLPQTLDFYTIKINQGKSKTYITNHLGEIRPDYFRMGFLNMENSSEYWLVGYLGKNMVYFSQHPVLNKNLDQIVKVENYKIQDITSSEVAQKEINLQNHENRNLAIWTSLNFLFLFILIVLLIKKLKWS